MRSRSGSAPPWVRTKRATPAPTSSPTRLVHGGRRGPTPREGGQPLGPRIEADRQPVAGDGEARPEVVRPVGDRGREDDPRRAGGEGEPDRLGRIHAAGDLERDGDPGGDRADGLEVRRRAGAGAVEVDEVDEPRAQRHEPLGDPVRAVGRGADAGRGARPVDDPRAAALEVDGRDDLHDPVRPSAGRAAGGGS